LTPGFLGGSNGQQLADAFGTLQGKRRTGAALGTEQAAFVDDRQGVVEFLGGALPSCGDVVDIRLRDCRSICRLSIDCMERVDCRCHEQVSVLHDELCCGVTGRQRQQTLPDGTMDGRFFGQIGVNLDEQAGALVALHGVTAQRDER